MLAAALLASTMAVAAEELPEQDEWTLPRPF
jgi:hypothetical protein